MSSHKRTASDEGFVPDTEEQFEKDSMDTESLEAEKKKNKRKKHWKEEEELEFLNEMARYWQEKNSDPATDIDGFLEFMRPGVGRDFSQIQLRNKIKSINKMYNKAGNKGKAIVGSHGEKILKISNSIWGQKIELGKGGTVKDAEEEVITGQTCFNELFRYHTKIASRVGHGGEEILMQALDLVGEKCWKNGINSGRMCKSDK